MESDPVDESVITAATYGSAAASSSWLNAGEEAEEVAPFSQATVSHPSRRRSSVAAAEKWQEAKDQVIGKRPSNGNIAASDGFSKGGFERARQQTKGSRKSLGEAVPTLQQLALQKEHRRHSILLKLAEVETNYDALFARRMREAGSIDRDELQADVRKVRSASKTANRWLLQPHGGIMQLMDSLTVFALLYTAIISPYEIAFLSDFTSITLEVINYIILTIFAVGIVTSFFVPYREAAWKGGALIRDHKKIAIRYLTTWFIFDLVSTIPFDVIAAAASDPTTGDPNDMSTADANAALKVVRGARLVRLIRLTRLLKLGRLLRAQRIVARLIEPLEQRSEMFNISFTVKTAIFWVIFMLVVLHWFCCLWGILSLIQETQRTDELVASLSDECHAEIEANVRNLQTNRYECLADCELVQLANITGRKLEYVTNEEPWICRRIANGLISGDSQMAIYFHLLYHQGLLRNIGGRTGKMSENIMFFFLSFIYLVLNTLFIGTISGARANANPLTKAWQGRMDHLNLFLREMHAPQELRRKTRQYLRNTRELELKRSFNTLYGHFSKQLAGEMMSHMSISVVCQVCMHAHSPPPPPSPENPSHTPPPHLTPTYHRCTSSPRASASSSAI